MESQPGAPWSRDLAGRIDEHVLESEALHDNPLGDPHRRPLWVYTPPGAGGPLPSIYLIQGHTGQLDMWRNRSAFRPNVPELVDALFAEEGCPPALVVFVDAWTSYGGSQFLDSPGVGRYHTYLCDEVVPFVDGAYPTLRAAAHRGVAGKSSGGYGAMVTPMLRPDLFGALATHAGDALFELCYLPDFRDATRALRDAYEGSFERFWDDFRSRPAFTRGTDFALLNSYAMAACYSANDDGSVDLPFDPATGELRGDVWRRWLEWDPVRMVDRHADALRGLRAIYIDSGKRDQYYLDLGAEAFRRALERIGVTDVFFELFDGTHSSIEYRYPLAIRYIAERLQPT
jgi:S-formylglutathione hydrolase FrmB